MTDIEARAFVTQAVLEGMLKQSPQAKASDVLEAAQRLVDVIVDSYFQCRISGPKTERKVS